MSSHDFELRKICSDLIELKGEIRGINACACAIYEKLETIIALKEVELGVQLPQRSQQAQTTELKSKTDDFRGETF